ARAAQARLRLNAEQLELALDEEAGDVVEREPAVRPVPHPDAVVEAEQCPGEQLRVALRQQSLLHPACEERAPRELVVALSRPCALARGFLPHRSRLRSRTPVLGPGSAPSQPAGLAQLEPRATAAE